MADLPVLLVLVATNGGPWLRDTIAGIKSQTHGAVDIVAVDNASTDRSRQALERAFGKENVVRLERRVGYARAVAAGLKAAGDRAATAGAFLFLHDDCAMDPDTLAILVDAIGYEDAGIAGPKLVEWADPEVVQEAGLSIDRYARSFDPLDKGELDQGQHDRIRETMWVSSACMLVSREVIERAGFFDHRYVAFREDLDLCWRARLAGFKVAFAGTARARHAAATLREQRAGWAQGRTRYFIERNLFASLVKNYSRARLFSVLPLAVLFSLGNAVVMLFSGRRREAGQIVEALRWNAAHLPSTIRARAKAQRARKVSDAEIARLAVGGAHRMRSLLERVVERIAGEPAVGVEEAEGLATPGDRVRKRLRDRVREHRVGVAIAALVLLYVIGSRELFRAGGLAGTDMPPFPDGPMGFFRSFFSGWRSAGPGIDAPAPTAHFLAGLFSVFTLGSTWLAQRVLLFLFVPVAGLTAARFASALGCGVAARRVAGFVYALSPLALWALGEGRVADMALVAAAPGLCVPLARAAGVAPAARGWRGIVGPAIGCAVATAFAPWTIVFVAGAGIAFAAGAFVSGRGDRAVRVLATSFVLAGSTLVLLFPWSIELFLEGSPLGVGGGLPAVLAEDLIRLSPPGTRGVPLLLAAAIPLAAAAGLALAPRERDGAARAVAVAGILGFLAAWAVARGVPWIAPRASLPLTLLAVAASALVGLGVQGIQPTLRSRQFGLSQLGLGAVVVALALALGAGGAWVVGGDRPGIAPAGSLAPAFLSSDRGAVGEYRVLWLDGNTDRVAAALTAPTGDTMTTYAERRAGPGVATLDRIVAGIATGRVDAAGRQLATFGVRYVFVRPGSAPELVEALGRQSDLQFRQRFAGSTVFRNMSWLPVASAVSAQGWALASTVPEDRTAAAIAGAEPDPKAGRGFRRVAPDLYQGDVPSGAKRVLLGTTYDPRWRLVAHDADRTAPAGRSFGWGTGFAAPGAGAVSIVWGGQGRYRLALLAQLAILVALAVALSRRVAIERGER